MLASVVVRVHVAVILPLRYTLDQNRIRHPCKLSLIASFWTNTTHGPLLQDFKPDQHDGSLYNSAFSYRNSSVKCVSEDVSGRKISCTVAAFCRCRIELYFKFPEVHHWTGCPSFNLSSQISTWDKWVSNPDDRLLKCNQKRMQGFLHTINWKPGKRRILWTRMDRAKIRNTLQVSSERQGCSHVQLSPEGEKRLQSATTSTDWIWVM